MEAAYLVSLIVAVAVVLAIAATALFARRRPSRPAVAPVARPAATERLRRALQATRERLVAAFGRPSGDVQRVLPDLEEALVSADVGVRTAAELVERVRSRMSRGTGEIDLRRALREEIEATLVADAAPPPSTRPWVVLVLGVNGV